MKSQQADSASLPSLPRWLYAVALNGPLHLPCKQPGKSTISAGQSHMSQSNPPFWSCACMQGGAVLLVYPKYVFPLPTQPHTQECPICTVSYPSMNTASCCSARVCTECFVYHQTASDPPGKAQCPFCKYTPFAVRVSAGACSRAVLSWLSKCLLWCAVVCWAPHLKQCRTPLLHAWECAHRCCSMQGYAAAVWVDGWEQNADCMVSATAGFAHMSAQLQGAHKFASHNACAQHHTVSLRMCQH